MMVIIKKIAIPSAVLLALTLYSPWIVKSAHANNYVCASDFNGDGVFDDAGETASCDITNSGDAFCSLDAMACVATAYECSLDDIDGNFISQAECATACKKTVYNNCPPGYICAGWYSRTEYGVCSAVQADGVLAEAENYICPIEGNTCIELNGSYQCSPSQCVDLNTNPVIDNTTPAESVADDGERDITGACLDQSLIFSGRNMSCQKSGVYTTFSSCCQNDESVYQDSVGQMNSQITSKTIQTTYEVAMAAYEAYKAGKTATEIYSAAQGAAGFNPYVVVAMYVITNVMKGCTQEDAETSALNGSNYCVYIGDYCTKEWPLVGCVQESEAHCCFNSKLARIMQEQGRPQLGMDWGDTESPNCSGFSTTQFQALDFSRMDLSEYYGDIQTQSQSLIQENLSEDIEDFYNKLK